MSLEVLFLWDNFGPVHVDRCGAVGEAFPRVKVVGLELHGRSGTYDWDPPVATHFSKITLFQQGQPRGLKLILALIMTALKFSGRNERVWFVCHYDWYEIFIFAIILRLRGEKVFTMGCSKFDDVPRKCSREWLKSFFFMPYQGAIGSGVRSRDYFRFLGLPGGRIVGEYNTVSLERIRLFSGEKPAPDGVPHENRHFTIIARLVPKKNIGIALRAYAHYRRMSPGPRPLHLCGSGPLEEELRALCAELDIESAVVFQGFVQTEGIARILAASLALVLPSIEEQFGNVVIEAQAMGVPVILSDNCGARDHLVRSGVNGFVVEPDNPEGLAWFMQQLASDEALWRRMCLATHEYAGRSDVAAFAEGVRQLAGLENS